MISSSQVLIKLTTNQLLYRYVASAYQLVSCRKVQGFKRRWPDSGPRFEIRFACRQSIATKTSAV